ncbi:MAG: ribosome-associated translation inhibitor RaiA [Magnetococcales bacterium]|nr:ribosome-associated translation inhibitor RaiA [Magnetococcales bacterium]
MEVKLEGRNVEVGDEMRERIQSKLDNLDRRFGPITHARVTIERHTRKNDQRAEAKAVINIAGNTITASKEAATVPSAVNETLDTLTQEMRSYVEKQKKRHHRR